MATERWWECSSCGSIVGAETLHKELTKIGVNQRRSCSDCGETMTFILQPQFAQSAGSPKLKVEAVFQLADPPTWMDGDSEVRFDPKLVFMRDCSSGDPWIWTPYWHVVTTPGQTPKTKWGQFAQMLERDFFVELLKQAEEYGALSCT